MVIIVIEIIIFGLVVIFILIILLIYFSKVQPEIYKSKSVYSDHSYVPEKSLFSKIYLLAGKPDMILKNKDGNVPVEIKSGFRPEKPRKYHVMQLASYCLLLEGMDKRPKYGLLQYKDGSPFKIDYTIELKNKLIKNIMFIRKSILSNKLLVENHDKNVCRYCMDK